MSGQEVVDLIQSFAILLLALAFITHAVVHMWGGRP